MAQMRRLKGAVRKPPSRFRLIACFLWVVLGGIGFRPTAALSRENQSVLADFDGRLTVGLYGTHLLPRLVDRITAVAETGDTLGVDYRIDNSGGYGLSFGVLKSVFGSRALTQVGFEVGVGEESTTALVPELSGGYYWALTHYLLGGNAKMLIPVRKSPTSVFLSPSTGVSIRVFQTEARFAATVGLGVDLLSGSLGSSLECRLLYGRLFLWKDPAWTGEIRMVFYHLN